MPKTPESTIDFIKYMLEYFTFHIHCIQTDNCTEYTYCCLNSSKINIFDEYCLKNKLERKYIAVHRYNGVMEIVLG
ncbi:hypothetical protein [uncultured Brachyspira sp.]|uniref:hypothetical protein n=1 Tax=uncultured Brachyspira sp. TaxID=221953 RepID=UPI0026132A41|nr:hypothetical protein [uncultured Brachyspira sp.]